MGLYGSPDLSNKKEKKSKPKKPFYKRWWLWVIIVIFISGIIGGNEEGTTITSGETKKEELKEIGTRLHPAKIGEIQQGNVTDATGSDCVLEVELLEVKKKEDAAEMAKDIYTYVELGENQEYLFAKFRVKYVKNNSNEDIPFNFNWTNFTYATGDYKKYNYTMGLVAGGELLEAIDLYEGAEHSGWICLYVEKDDPQPKAVFLNNLWFDL